MATITKENHVNIIPSLLIVVLSSGYFKCSLAEIQQYCKREDFNPKCGRNEVLIMTHAVYGRMELNRCVKQDMGYLGCKTDIIRILEKKCSNRNACFIDLNNDIDENEDVENTCGELMRYLEADFVCKSVFQIDQSSCRTGRSTVDVEHFVSLSSQNLYDMNCDTAKVTISARPGQTLNISIIDFSWDESHNPSRSCVNYLELEDLTLGRKTPVCAGATKQRHILNTTSHQILAAFQLQDPVNQRFLITFEAVGCGDIVPPDGTWVQRRGDETTLGCHHGDHTWTLTCKNNQWRGAVGDCGTGYKPPVLTDRVMGEEKAHIAPGMLLFAAVSLLMFFSASIFTIGVCVYSKRTESRYDKTSRIYIPQTQLNIGQPNCTLPYTGQLTSAQFNDNKQQRTLPILTEGETLTELEYMNTSRSKTDSRYSDSIKYYVLENMTGK